jgi:hypothetical protein
MRKIISLFARNYDDDRSVRDEIVPGAEWVIAGEGIPTEKIDGTSCMIREGKLFKRYDRGPGPKHPNGNPKPEPAGWIQCEDESDPNTGHWPGWMPVGDGPEDKVFREVDVSHLPDGTYELVGPKVRSNPYNLVYHFLVSHGNNVIPGNPRDFASIKQFLGGHRIEGIVWHHSDGRMVKIKARDFGIVWPWPKGKP